MYQHPDSTGKIGVELSRDLVKVAGKALTHNLTKLGPKVLPWSEKLLYAGNWVARKVVPGKWQEYVPDFKEAFDHFCLHAGMLQLLFAHVKGMWLIILHAAAPLAPLPSPAFICCRVSLAQVVYFLAEIA